jgi:hypothetical protein
MVVDTFLEKVIGILKEISGYLSNKKFNSSIRG